MTPYGDKGSTLAQVMACCLTAPSHYLNQCWLSSVRPSYIHLMTISQEICQSSMTKINMKITHLKMSLKSLRGQWVNLLRLSDAYLHHQLMSSLVHIVACRLFATKPLSEPMLNYCQLDPREQTSIKLCLKFKHFIKENTLEKNCLKKRQPFRLSLNLLNCLMNLYDLLIHIFQDYFTDTRVTARYPVNMP